MEKMSDYAPLYALIIVIVVFAVLCSGAWFLFR